MKGRNGLFSDKFEYVLAVAEEHTLTKAVKRLYVSQPTLTNYLNRLEDELGVKLFDRSTTPIKATAAGQLYIERMKKIQMESRILQEELRQMGRKRTTFTFGIGSARGSHWPVHIMPDFIQVFPHTAVKLYEAGEDRLEKGLLKGEIDMAVGVPVTLQRFCESRHGFTINREGQREQATELIFKFIRNTEV